jgi:hypothetical protein
MDPTVSRGLDRRQSPSTDQPADDRSTAVDHALELLRRAVADTGHTLDSLEHAMNKGRAFIHRVLNGDARCTLDFIVALPDDVEARFEELRAEYFGRVVVAPVSDDEARRCLAIGLFHTYGVAQLPARAERMAKATVAPTPAKATLRRTAGVVLIALCFAHPAAAADRPSMTALIAASVADAVTTEVTLRSTPGAYEANPLLAGHSIRRETTKALTTGALVWGLSRIGRSHPRWAMALGWTAAGALTAIAAHNASLSGAAR